MNFLDDLFQDLSGLTEVRLRVLKKGKCSEFNPRANQTTRMPYSSVLLCLSVTKIRITSVVPLFLKLGQMDFSKASNSISHHPTSIFRIKMSDFQIFWVGWVGR